MRKKAASTSAKSAFGDGHFLSSFVALIVHGDDKTADRLKETVENVACDWRITHARDGAEAARYMMNKGVPNLVIIGSEAERVTAADLVEWIRSFTAGHSVSILVYGQPRNKEEREHLLRNDATMISPEVASGLLTHHLARIVAKTEKFYLSPLTSV